MDRCEDRTWIKNKKKRRDGMRKTDGRRRINATDLVYSFLIALKDDGGQMEDRMRGETE